MAVWYVSSVKWAAIPQRANSTAYVVGDLVRRGPTAASAGLERVFRCTTAGTSASSEPTAAIYTGATNAVKGSTLTDGTVTWTEVTGSSTYGWNTAGGSITSVGVGYSSGAATTVGDTVYIASNHAESYATQPYAYPSGTTGSLVYASVDETADPPTTLKAGARVTITGGAWSPNTSANSFAELDMYGVTFKATTGIYPAGSATNSGRFSYTGCTFELTNSGNTNGILLNQSLWGSAIARTTLFRDCTFTFVNASQSILATVTDDTVVFENCTVNGSTVPNNLFGTTGASHNILMKGCDLSAVSGVSRYLVQYAANSSPNSRITFVDCKLGSSVNIINTATPTYNITTPTTTLINCDSTNTNYRYYRNTGEGTETHETTIVRSGGATDGTTAFSRKVVTSAYADDTTYLSYRSLPIESWKATTGSTTVTVSIINGDGLTLTDNDVWLEVEYPSSSATPVSALASSRTTNPIIGTPSNLATDTGATWTTTGLSSPVKQKLSVTFTQNAAGLLRATLCVRKASQTIYYDPKLQLS